jgi:hypothetical protein
MPFVALTLLGNSNILDLLSGKVNSMDYNLLITGFANILKCNPFTRKIAGIIELYDSKPINLERSSPFRVPHSNLSVKKEITCLTPRLSAYVPLNLPEQCTVTKELTATIQCNNSLREFIHTIKPNLRGMNTYLYTLYNKYTNVNCEIRLVCNDSIVKIKGSVHNGVLDSYFLEKTYLKNSYYKPNDIPSYSSEQFLTKVNDQYNLGILNKLVNNSIKDFTVFSSHGQGIGNGNIPALSPVTGSGVGNGNTPAFIIPGSATGSGVDNGYPAGTSLMPPYDPYTDLSLQDRYPVSLAEYYLASDEKKKELRDIGEEIKMMREDFEAILTKLIVEERLPRDVVVSHILHTMDVARAFIRIIENHNPNCIKGRLLATITEHKMKVHYLLNPSNGIYQHLDPQDINCLELEVESLNNEIVVLGR